MPLPRSDYGDFSASDPFSEMLRAAQDYYMPGRFPANPNGQNVTTASNYRPPMRMTASGPPQRIDLAAALAAQTPPTPTRAPGQPVMRTPPGWTNETLYASPVTGGQAAPSTPGMMGTPAPNMPMPAPGPRGNVPMPAVNPAFHDMPAATGSAMGGVPDRMRLARALAANGGQPTNAPFNQFNPADLMTQPWRA